MRVAFFEDRAAQQFTPIALLRPVFELICGRYSVRQRGLLQIDCDEWGVFVREYLAETYREEHRAAHVNDFLWLGAGSTLLINGRWLAPDGVFELLRGDEVGLIGDTVAYLTLDSAAAMTFIDRPWDIALAELARMRRPVRAEGELLNYPWDVVRHNASQLVNDFRPATATASRTEFGPQVAVLGKPDNVFVDPTAVIDPFTVLDARKGPVTVDREAAIRPFTRLEGPCYVGPNTEIFRAHVRGGTTIGPNCRVGGEIEQSILHGYVNSYHDGFLGHAYVCPWVNMGALTTNSDLKNDYSTVGVPLAGEMIDTGSTKVGCFIGDHTKTALASLFNTGSSVGVMSMVLPGGELLPKHIPSFSRVWHGELDDRFDLDGSIQTARTTLGRRGCELTAAQERLLRFLHDETAAEREAAVLRFREQQHRRSQASMREAS